MKRLVPLALFVALFVPAIPAQASSIDAAAGAVAIHYPVQFAQACAFAEGKSFDDLLALFRPYYHHAAREYALPRHPRQALQALLARC